ncbi:hypothetical protein [Reichenbachiella ulvae]|uniref:Oxygen tolerance n=1 Tax=Reichenbachiella ulvae TaxID=2980104 RepID=A0ABT3CS05_9BACT|nr:hypothetical protein [Reichenbachiella ulvae]MCV9386402.1 hypothetical protein [Reichenbachiella ulvae]
MASLHAQNIQPKGFFVQDSMKLGEEIEYTISIAYPKDWQVVLPDSNFNYSPFEFSRKSYAPTRSDSTLAIDSITYTLSSFEIDPVQKLQLPVYVVKGKDSIEILSNMDSIIFKELIQNVPDSIILKQNLAFKELEYSINYWYISIGVALLIVILVAVYYFFGSQIIARYKLYQLNRDYKKFMMQFEEGVQKVKANQDNTHAIEAMVLLWKQFMERMENRPFTKYTSKEIVAAGYGDGLKGVLQKIDSAIYGRLTVEDIYRNLDSLSHFTTERFERKREEVKNG